jgi:hypothetical protein
VIIEGPGSSLEAAKPSFHLSSSREHSSEKGPLPKTENVNGTASSSHSAGLGIQREKHSKIISRIRIT